MHSHDEIVPDWNHPLNPVCEEVTSLHLEGNIVPDSWCKKITTGQGKPDFLAIMILADIWYWYRLTIVKDEETNEVVERRKKFKSDKLQKSYSRYALQFGVSKERVKESIDRLEELNLISREFRTIATKESLVLTNVLFLEPIVVSIKSISLAHPRENPPHGGGSEGGEVGGSEGGEVPPKKGGTYTESTSESTSELVPLRGNKRSSNKNPVAASTLNRKDRKLLTLIHPEQDIIRWMLKTAKDYGRKPWNLSARPGPGSKYQGPRKSDESILRDKEKHHTLEFVRLSWLKFLDDPTSDEDHFPFPVFIENYLEKAIEVMLDERDRIEKPRRQAELQKLIDDSNLGWGDFEKKADDAG